MSEKTEAPVVVDQEQPEELQAPVQEQEQGEEFVYKYQPRDGEGRFLGGEQVIKATSMQDALDKMAEQNSQLIQLNRRLKRDAALGKPVDDLPADTPRTAQTTADFRPVPLTADERWKLTRDLNDPERFDAAADKLLESRLGATPEAIRATLTQAQNDIAALRAQEEAKAFVAETPDYYICQENFETIAGWMIKNKLQPTKNNFGLAYQKLTDAGLLLSAPMTAQESDPANAQQEAEPDARISVPDSPPLKRPVVAASGLTRQNSSSSGGAARKSGYSEADVAKMSADEYRQKVLLPLLRRGQAR